MTNPSPTASDELRSAAINRLNIHARVIDYPGGEIGMRRDAMLAFAAQPASGAGVREAASFIDRSIRDFAGLQADTIAGKTLELQAGVLAGYIAQALAEVEPVADGALLEQVERLKLQLADSRGMVAKLSAHNSKLAGGVEANPPISLEAGSWWYPEGDTSSDECRYSAGEVVDYAVEGMTEGESRVVVIERALHLPDVYAAVHVFTEQEKDERDRDDDSEFTLHATLEEAQAALPRSGQEG